MTRTSLETHNCSLARTVDIIGDKWVLMILREAFYGTRTFTAFQSRLGIAKTVLSDRLQRLTGAALLRKIKSKDGGERAEYRLTAAGRDLFPIVVALVQWGDRWIYGAGHEPLTIVDHETRSPVQPVAVQARNGRVLAANEVTFISGPGGAGAARAVPAPH